YIARFPRINLKKGRYIDSPMRLYEVKGEVDCFNVPNSFLVHSMRYGTQMLKAIKHCDGDANDLYTLQLECALLLSAEQVHPDMKRHILTMNDRGTTKDFSYLVVNRVGPSLDFLY
ncbi:hypothetical protein PFISCL1PPCAC_1212, partial [Pristionchus fissidentatus]